MKRLLILLALLLVGCGDTLKDTVRIDVYCDSTRVQKSWNGWSHASDSVYVDHRRGTPCDTILKDPKMVMDSVTQRMYLIFEAETLQAVIIDSAEWAKYKEWKVRP